MRGMLACRVHALLSAVCLSPAFLLRITGVSGNIMVTALKLFLAHFSRLIEAFRSSFP